MAEDNKKEFAVDLLIDPFSEMKKEGVPPWFAARPKLAALVQEIPIKRKLRLDPRKWSMKDIESGVQAVARYELAAFATVLNTCEKDIDKVFDALKTTPKNKRDAKFFKALKKPGKDEETALEAAEKKTSGFWKKFSKVIEDKVSLALEDAEADKVDHTKTIAAGKQALKTFEALNTADLFDVPLQRVLDTMKTLALAIAALDGDTEQGYQSALRTMRDIESDYDRVSRDTEKVSRMFLALGEKLSRDRDGDPDLLKFGQTISRGPVRTSFMRLNSQIADVARDLDMLVNFVAQGTHGPSDVAAKAIKFKKDHEKKRGSVRTTTAVMHKLADMFKKVEKKLT